MRRPTHNSAHRRTRWTPLEIVLIALALLLISTSTIVELYRWTNPPVAPAAPRADESATTEPSVTVAATEIVTDAPTATDAPTVSPTATQLPTATPSVVDQPTATEPPATATAEPSSTAVPPSTTPTPTVFLVDPPLTMSQSASATSVRPGDQVNFTIVVGSSSTELRRVVVRNQLDQRLEVIEASSASGTCTPGQVVACSVELTRSTPATITIAARVGKALVPGITLTSQATAQDDQYTTAASNRIIVTVAGPVSLSSEGSLTAPAATQAATVVQATLQATAQATAQPPAEATATPEVVAAADAPAAPAPAPPAPALPLDDAALRGTPVLPPTLVPESPAPAPAPGPAPAPISPPTASPVLPNTSATLPALGLGVGLFGFALALHGTRRVRRADAALANEGAAFRRLSPLVDQATEFQHATISEIDRMQHDSEAMQSMLRGVTRKQSD